MKETIQYVNGELIEKSKAVISIFDSGFQHGDGVYEGIRVYKDKVFMLDEHIQRCFESAKSIDINIGISKAEMKEIVLKTVRANKGIDNLHIRLSVTRGRKRITGMSPKLIDTKASIVLCVDEKPPIFNKEGIKLITSTLRRYSPNLLDSKIHDLNQLNQIMANIEADRQEADEAIMLDVNGFVAETNGTTIFMFKEGVLYTPTTKYILVGITRKLIMQIAKENNIPVQETDLSLSDFYNADEVFICGTVGEIVPVKEIDGKCIGVNIPGELTVKLSDKYKKLTETLGASLY